jgi:hypothetical protein
MSVRKEKKADIIKLIRKYNKLLGKIKATRDLANHKTSEPGPYAVSHAHSDYAAD